MVRIRLFLALLLLLLVLAPVGCSSPGRYHPGLDPNRGDATPFKDGEHTKLERELSLYSD
jgi:hypothetical protein